MTFASEMTADVLGLIREFGTAALGGAPFQLETVTAGGVYNAATGGSSSATVALVTLVATDLIPASQRGRREAPVLDTDGDVYVAASGLATAPTANHVLVRGSQRYKIAEVETFSVQGSPIAYRLAVKVGGV